MKTLKTFVSGLLLSTVLLLPSAIRAAELQPFFTLKTSSINSLVAVAQKIATMAGVADKNEFMEVIQNVKAIKGFNFDADLGFAAVVDKDENINMLLMLPISDLEKADIPAEPMIFDSIRPFLTPRGQGRTDINSPMGTFVALQKQGYLVIVPEDIVDQVPADARKLFADLNKYTFGVKLDLEKVKFETLEEQLFGWILMFAMMQDPDMGEQLEQLVEICREIYKEISVISSGFVFNPQTADIEFSTTTVVRKGSDFAKSFSGYKAQPTIFSGFRGTPGNTIFTIGDSGAMPPLPENALMKMNMKNYDSLFSGILEQIEMEDEDGAATKIAKEVIDTIKKIVDTESKRGSGDYAFSFSTDSTLLGAFDTASLADIQKLAMTVMAFANEKMPAEGKALLEKSLKKEYVTVEGFKVSGVSLPIVPTLEAILGENAPDNSLNDLTLGILWATKDAGGKQAIAFAAGLDFAKAEAAFKSALEKTKTPASVQKPMGVFSIQGLGKFFQQTVVPIAAKAGATEGTEFIAAKKIFDKFASAGNDATIQMNIDIKTDRVEENYRVSGKVIEALVEVIKIGIQQSGSGAGFGDF